SGVVVLNFVNSASPIANSEIRVSKNSQSPFQSGNTFEGLTDESGNVTIGPLNAGIYYYRLDLGTKGFLMESFEVISGSSTGRSIDISQFISQGKLEIDNLDQSFNYNSVNYYLISSSITTTNNDSEGILENAIRGVFDTDKIVFESVVSGYYYLYFEVNAELIRSESFYSPLFIQRDYDFSSSFTFPIDLVLMVNSWDIIGSADLSTGNTVNDAFSSISFDLETINFIFNDSTTFSTEYSTSTFPNGSTDIFLDNTTVDGSLVWRILDVFYLANGDLTVEYYDQNFNDHVATFK
ncbi:MAG: hypothetical protein AAGI25_21280, partial [Bacteroidota bacterium]